MDWDRLFQNVARGSDFTGRTAKDEQAYFEAFGAFGEAPPDSAKDGRLHFRAATFLGFVQGVFVLKSQ